MKKLMKLICKILVRAVNKDDKFFIFVLYYIPLIKIKQQRIFLFFFIPITPKREFVFKCCSKIFCLFPIKKFRVCFWNMAGQGFGDNPKYIALEMLKDKQFDLIWLYDKKKLKFPEEFPENIKLVDCFSFKALYYLTTCHIFISNVRQNILYKRKGQKYIHTWHGNMGFKKIEADYPNLPGSYIQLAKQDSKDIDFLSSGAVWSENTIFKKTFWYSGEYFRGGNPRNDILFKHSGKIESKIREYFNIPVDIKILLYAPTFRDNHDQNVYNIDYKRLKDTLDKCYSNSWVVLSRLHPNMIMEQNILPEYDWLKDATLYPDMQELLAVADILITDYSSSIFDFLITGRPAFIYAPDKQYYFGARGSYIEMEDTPIPIAQDNNQLMYNIQNLDADVFAKSTKDFLHKMGSYDKGNASEQLVKLIKKL